MTQELQVFSVYVPAALAWAVVAIAITSLLRGALLRLPLHRILWHPAFAEFALFMLVWWGLARLADNFLPRGLIS